MCECFWYWVSTLVQSLFGCLLKENYVRETKTRYKQQRPGPRSKIAGLNYLGDYSHDNIDVGYIMKGLCKQPSSPAAVFINSGNEKSKGEHWEAINISHTDLMNKSRVEFFDSYGLPHIQDETSKLLDLLSQKDGVCNLQPVQDIMDMTSRACGQHCLYYLMNGYYKPELNLEDLIKGIYHICDLKANDFMVTVFCESVLFKNKTIKTNQTSYLLLIISSYHIMSKPD